MNKDIFAGKFIVLDGGDGCGKSTQANLLSEHIQSLGCEVESFRDPGTTVIGEAIREILLGHDYAGMGDNVEVLLYMAARAQLWKEKISPAILAGKCVVMDRWLSSTCAYQGYAGDFGIENVINLAKNSLERSFPDITIILDLPRRESSARLNRELDRMEIKGDTYHNKVRDGYIELSKICANSSDWNGLFGIVDASGNINTVQERVKKKLSELLKQ